MTKINFCIGFFTICHIISLKPVNSQFASCTNNEFCVPFRECEKVNKILTKSRFLSIEDKSYFRRIQCKVVNRIPYVCCESNVNLEDKLPKAPKCGMQFNDRVLGGTETNIDEYPWTVQIYHKNTNGSTESFCGGALINERYVLTAAHCTKFNLVKVRLGDWDVRTNPDCQTDEDGEQKCNNPYVEIPIENIMVHVDYNFSNIAQCNDIALIKLQKDVEFSEFIKPICLPIDQYVQSMNITGHHVEIAGFGITESNTTSVRKMKLGMHVSPQKLCEKIYARYGVVINSKQICAGGEAGKDSCNGDSGGALMKQIIKPRELSYYSLVGLVSFGPTKCGTKDHPAVYTRISEFMDWIINNMD